MRDNFSERVKRIVADRVGNRCSKPDCRALTSGPQLDGTQALNVGVAAHITAASRGGPRFDPALSAEERRQPDNAIWLCQTCGKLVDNDPTRFTEAVLREWKRSSEEYTFAEVHKSDLDYSHAARNEASRSVNMGYKRDYGHAAFQYPDDKPVIGVKQN